MGEDLSIGCVQCMKRTARTRNLCTTCYGNVAKLAGVIGWKACEDRNVCGPQQDKAVRRRRSTWR